MPYIKPSDREFFDKTIDYRLIGENIQNAGELNYVITKICLAYLKAQGQSYQVLNNISGALTNANLELYRRVTAEYENKKIEENGDVY